MKLFRHTDSRFPFLWESREQPPARWHAAGDGPVQYFADTPDGAWAEFLRHEGITEAGDLIGIERDLWAVELPDGAALATPALPVSVMRGGLDTYPLCQAEARRLRELDSVGLDALSAALDPGTAGGWYTRGGRLISGPTHDGRVIVLFGARPDLAGWRACSRGRPDANILSGVHQLPPH